VSRLKSGPVWLLLVAAAAALIVVGATRDRGASSNSDRITAIARSLKCPVCAGESIDQSQAPVALTIREDIARLVASGKTDPQIRAEIERSYPGSQLVPPAEGANLVLWVLPVVVLVLGLGGVALAFRRWRVQADAAGVPDDDDRALVDAALRAETDAP
jgi:cytochrome c-type biogenesis protein CcmH